MIPKLSPNRPTKKAERNFPASVPDMLFEQLDVVVKDLMGWPGMTAYEKMVDLCYQEHPTSLKDFVSITRVKR